jgi:hypothetical protein
LIGYRAGRLKLTRDGWERLSGSCNRAASQTRRATPGCRCWERLVGGWRSRAAGEGPRSNTEGPNWSHNSHVDVHASSRRSPARGKILSRKAQEDVRL